MFAAWRDQKNHYWCLDEYSISYFVQSFTIIQKTWPGVTEEEVAATDPWVVGVSTARHIWHLQQLQKAIICKQQFQTIQVLDKDCMVQKIPGNLVSLEVEGQSSPVKYCAILIALAAKAFYENFSQPPNKYEIVLCLGIIPRMMEMMAKMSRETRKGMVAKMRRGTAVKIRVLGLLCVRSLSMPGMDCWEPRKLHVQQASLGILRAPPHASERRFNTEGLTKNGVEACEFVPTKVQWNDVRIVVRIIKECGFLPDNKACLMSESIEMKGEVAWIEDICHQHLEILQFLVNLGKLLGGRYHQETLHYTGWSQVYQVQKRCGIGPLANQGAVRFVEVDECIRGGWRWHNDSKLRSRVQEWVNM
ncbi:hypothetical protein K443DRAFT_120757 [Laccaria amethystina LaAM-08-1]|uniref:Uncharacterized protein n=1 Tax=Laccaria amethystina LaAM-08-1 TaxID=1095629 RepID=A0A0C9XIN8_9AGAR|nr:hypothetical protein K443DRAFT_120757 [Laccaria amethystina LaAM-08-1]